ncbi:hypothetical protein AB0O28_14270 [Microbispora sp. NPDC088329]|uniref:hypothetical protein n=1 Tax=Microbispora sp. NPDC088329 TaxID=3154869 RepID=UPI0034197078
MPGRRAQRPIPRWRALWYVIPVVFFLAAAVFWALALVAWVEPKPLFVIFTPDGAELPAEWYRPGQWFWTGAACFLAGLVLTVVLALVRRRGAAPPGPPPEPPSGRGR